MKFIYIAEMIGSTIRKSVKSSNLCKSVILTKLSYDIVKANGGEISVESEDGEGNEFILQLLKTNQ